MDKKDADKWWDLLSEEERKKAFFSVCYRIYESEIVDRGSYKFALYDKFNFTPGDGSFGLGIECGFKALHDQLADVIGQDGTSDVETIELVDRPNKDFIVKEVDQLTQSLRVRLDRMDKTLSIVIENERL
jgi:hypothetical protein